MVRMVNLMQSTIKMVVPLALACECELTEAQLPGARDLYSTVAQAASHTQRQEKERIAKWFDASDATQSVCGRPHMCKTM